MLAFIAFDLDGTLIDSKRDIVDSVNAALASEGLPILPPGEIEDLVGRGARNLIQRAIGDPSDEILNRVFVKFWNEYLQHCLDHTALYPGVAEFLEAAAHLPMAVVTNKPEMFTRKILKGLGLESRFRWVIGGDTLPLQKPDPRIFDPIVDSLPPPVRGLMVGDSAIDIECGKAAGLWTCGVCGGFRPREELAAAGPDFLIGDFSGLKGLPLL
ncbi:MAG: HAD family hydrolase, partial [Candidatus Binatia bacterium]